MSCDGSTNWKTPSGYHARGVWQKWSDCYWIWQRVVWQVVTDMFGLGNIIRLNDIFFLVCRLENISARKIVHEFFVYPSYPVELTDIASHPSNIIVGFTSFIFVYRCKIFTTVIVVTKNRPNSIWVNRTRTDCDYNVNNSTSSGPLPLLLRSDKRRIQIQRFINIS